jgi:hypothetical protein
LLSIQTGGSSAAAEDGNGGEREEADQAEYSGQIQEMLGHR